MTIAKDKVVTIEYTLKNDEGNVLDTSEGREPLVYLHGSGNIIPGLEKELEGKIVSDSLSVRVSPEEGYGEKSEHMIQTVPKDMFGDANIEINQQYHAAGPSGEPIVITVVDINDEGVTVDGNHPLAGVYLNFDVEVKEIRDATAEELEHGHVHGPGGHAH
ncbi:MAG: peptidylprolyl isomerase [Gammaproteobacteria bacterium]|nr:peptidylprolyl isomerase [Gammaproteobacteria bacterium]MDH5728389.1 peptidylprolyl isomerase [Gammaproteobacteria bacterium]